MKPILVKKSDLLTVLKKNRDSHRDLFLKAQQGFRRKAIARLDEMLERAKAGKEIELYVSLQAPIDQTADYDRVIGMLEMSIEDKIELDERSYQQYVLDEWTWSAATTHLNTSYLENR